MPGLTLRDITKRYGTRQSSVDALRGVDLEIPQGSYIAILGESGSGKSTLLNILGLLDAPSTGNYLIDSQDVAALKERAACAHRSETFAFVFQAFHLLDRRSVVENVELSMHYRGVDATRMRTRALAALADVGIPDLADAKPRQLSGGQRQRVAIARALASGAPIIVADEPTGNLDSSTTEAVMTSFENLRHHGATLVLVTHSEQIAQHADRQIHVVDGKVQERTEDGCTERLPLIRPREEPKTPGKASTVRPAAAVRDAAANMLSRPGRAAGLIAAIAVAATLFVATLGLSATAQQQVSESFDAVKSRDVTATVSGDGVSATIETGIPDAARSLAELNGSASVAILEDLGTASVRVGAPRDAVDTSTYASYGDIRTALRLDIDWTDAPVASLASNQVLVGEYLAEGIGMAPVDLAPTIEIAGRTLVVVGVITDSPRAPDLLGKAVIGGGESPESANLPTSTVTAYVVTELGAAASIAEEAPLVLDPVQPERVDVASPPPADSLRANVEASVALSLALLTIVTGLAAAASVTIATLSAVAERRNEIGLRRAIGARKSHIATMLLLESLLIGLFGSLLGIVTGMAAVLAVTIAQRWTPVFDPVLALAALGAGIAIAALGAIAGAVRANRIVPADALRS
ncbi:ATP-binding cassette domain-containing protein [Microbacterium foliorum]|uniref:ABC transporter ATP-binding protein/permease n=1 Tax=Microbacterium foliorum TaxID=104336 RepID=UPI003735ACE2